MTGLTEIDPELFRTLENAIRYGTPVLLEDVNEGEGLKAIDSLLQQDIIKQSGSEFKENIVND